MSSEPQRLIDDARELGVTLNADQAAGLLRLLDELASWNRHYNLTAITERESMIRAHLLDSLSAQADLQGTLVADVGTGAGFPGLPLALAQPQRQFTLIDSVAKKIRFVSHAVRVLGLTNVAVLSARAESLTPEPPFDTVVARAFARVGEDAAVEHTAGQHRYAALAAQREQALRRRAVEQRVPAGDQHEVQVTALGQPGQRGRGIHPGADGAHDAL